MDRRERLDDQVEAVRAALDGRQAELWTALPGVVERFDPAAMTVAVQPAVKGRITLEDGSQTSVSLPLLVDVPVVFPSGGGFTLTFPVAPGDDCLVVFASRCIDAWWQSGGVQEPLEARMHDLSDGFALVGPFSQLRVLPGVSAEDVQLRTDDGQAHVTIQPDYTIQAVNPAASVVVTPNGQVSAEADAKITLRAPQIAVEADSFSMSNLAGGNVTAAINGDIALNGDLNQTGGITSTGDHVAGGISQTGHVHIDVVAGSDLSGEPQ